MSAGTGESFHPGSRNLFQAIVDQAPDAIVFADRKGIIRIWNRCAAAMFGYASAEAIGQSLDIIIPADLRSAHWHGYHRAIAEGRTLSAAGPLTTRGMHKDGSKLYLELAFAIVRDDAHHVMGALATARQSARREQTARDSAAALDLRTTKVLDHALSACTTTK